MMRPVAQRPWKSDWIAAPIGPATVSKEIRRFGERLKRHRPRNRALDTVTPRILTDQERLVRNEKARGSNPLTSKSLYIRDLE
jgi:hypothetical protein